MLVLSWWYFLVGMQPGSHSVYWRPMHASDTSLHGSSRVVLRVSRDPLADFSSPVTWTWLSMVRYGMLSTM